MFHLPSKRRRAKIDKSIVLNYLDETYVSHDTRAQRRYLETRLADLLGRVNLEDLIEHRRTPGYWESDTELVTSVLMGTPAERAAEPYRYSLLGHALGTLELNARRQAEWQPGEMERAVEDVVAGRRDVESVFFRVTDLMPVLMHTIHLAHDESLVSDLLSESWDEFLPDMVLLANENPRFCRTLTRLSFEMLIGRS